MRFPNEGQSDRAVRMLAGIVFVAAGWMLALNTLSVAFRDWGHRARNRHRRVVSGLYAVRNFYGEDAGRPLSQLRHRPSSRLMGACI